MLKREAVVHFEEPDVLVLGGGGVLGEAWMSGLLVGIADASGFDPCGCAGYVGTSAGSIVAAALVAGIDPRTRLGELPSQPDVDQRDTASSRAGRIAGAATGVLSPLAELGLRAGSKGGEFLRRAGLARVPRGRRSLAGLGATLDRSGAYWDGRLTIAAVDLATGRRVMFGADDAPSPPVGTAVEASCAIPGVFRPVTVEGREYVDGGVWSPTNLDRAPATRGTHVICLNPTASLSASRSFPYGAIGPVSRSLAAVEALALRRRGASVRTVAPDRATVAAIGGRLMDSSRRKDVIASALAQGRALAGAVAG